MRRSRRKLKPMPPPVYITLAEIKARGLCVHFDLIAPEDKKRISEASMKAFDDLPVAVRQAIKNAAEDPALKFDGNQLHSFTTWALQLLASGHPAEDVARTINTMDERIRTLRAQEKRGAAA